MRCIPYLCCNPPVPLSSVWWRRRAHARTPLGNTTEVICVAICRTNEVIFRWKSINRHPSLPSAKHRSNVMPDGTWKVEKLTPHVELATSVHQWRRPLRSAPALWPELMVSTYRLPYLWPSMTSESVMLFPLDPDCFLIGCAVVVPVVYAESGLIE